MVCFPVTAPLHIHTTIFQRKAVENMMNALLMNIRYFSDRINVTHFREGYKNRCPESRCTARLSREGRRRTERKPFRFNEAGFSNDGTVVVCTFAPKMHHNSSIQRLQVIPKSGSGSHHANAFFSFSTPCPQMALAA